MKKGLFLVLLFSILFGSLAGRASQSTELSKSLVLMRTQQRKALRQLESLFAKSNQLSETLKIAHVLSTANPSYLKKNTAIYAEYVLLNDKDMALKNRLQLMRVAADGFFEMGKFATATKWYNKIVKNKKSTFQQREYSLYKVAWSQINQSNPYDGFKSLAEWLKLSRKSSLRESMIIDMGRSLGEAVLDSKSIVSPLKATEKVIIPLSSSDERKSFSKGILRSAKRTKAEIKSVYALVKKLNIATEVWEHILASAEINKLSECFMLPLYSETEKKMWEGPVAVKRSQACAHSVLEKKPSSPVAYQKLGALLSKKVKPWISAKLAEGARDLKQACLYMIESEKQERLVWLGEAVALCNQNNNYYQVFIDHLLKNKAKFTSFTDFIVSKTTLPDFVKSEYISYKEIPKTLDREELLLSFLPQLDEEKRIYELEALCPLKKQGCMKYWVEHTKVSDWKETKKSEFYGVALKDQGHAHHRLAIEMAIKDKAWEKILESGPFNWKFITGEKRYLDQFMKDHLSLKLESDSKSLFKKVTDKIDREFLLSLVQVESINLNEVKASSFTPYVEKDKKVLARIGDLSSKSPEKALPEDVLMGQILGLQKQVKSLRSASFQFVKLKALAKNRLVQKINHLEEGINLTMAISKEPEVWTGVKKELQSWRAL